MKRLLVLVEGQTEQTFFRQVLSPHLIGCGVDARCTMICTARDEGRRAFRGGHGHRWEHIEKDLRNLLGSRPDAVTTIIDLYGFPIDAPGYPERMPGPTRERVEVVAGVMRQAIGDSRFIPGLFAHEFEALLFSEPRLIVELAVLDDQKRERIADELRRIAAAFPTPEDINDSPETAPSKRILKHVPGYQKPRHGPLIAERIGLPTLRGKCPIFSEWLAAIERL